MEEGERCESDTGMEVDVETDERTSLKRLNELDSIPDLQSQLAEITKLCTQGAKAERGIKWLCGKLKQDENARSQPRTWEVLLATLRLISSERTAAILSTHDLLGHVRDMNESPGVSDRLLREISKLLNFLLELGTGSNGQVIRSRLSIPGPAAAIFFGAWLRTINSITNRNVASEEPFILDYEHLKPGLDIWKLRRHVVNDNEHFARYCFVPTALLLASKAFAPVSRPSKRTREDDMTSSPADVKGTLHQLLARHIFVPARNAFFESQEVTTRPLTGHQSDQVTTVLVTSLLEPLPIAMRESEINPSVLPLLLEIALRCSPTSTPRQRAKEVPWTENIFEALCNCNQDATGRFASEGELAEMLSVVRQHASLSGETLRKLVKRYINLSPGSHDTIDWKLVAQIVALDSGIFTERNTCSALFSAISDAAIYIAGILPAAPPEDDKSLNVRKIPPNCLADYDLPPDAKGGSLQLLWKNDIVLPILDAFVKTRDLVTFIDIWKDQLQHDNHNEIWSVWVQISNALSAHMQEVFSGSHQTELFDISFTHIAYLANRLSVDEPVAVGEQLSSTFITLETHLCGVRTESVEDAFDHKLEDLFEVLLKLAEPLSNVSAAEAKRVSQAEYWRLLVLVFELRFPTWAVVDDNISPIKQRGQSLLSSEAFAAAVKQSKRLSNPSAREAACFVAILCTTFLTVAGDQAPLRRTTCERELLALLDTDDLGILNVVVRYPQILDILDDHKRRSYLGRYMYALIWADGNSHIGVEVFQYIIAAAVARNQLELIKDMIDLSIDLLRSEDEFLPPIQNEHGATDEDEHEHKHRRNKKRSHQDVLDLRVHFGLMLLIVVPTRLFSRAQRELAVNAVSDLQNGENTPDRQNLRTAILVKLKGVPNPTSKLAADSHEVWRLPGSVLEDADAADPRVASDDVTMLEELAKNLAIFSEHNDLLLRRKAAICALTVLKHKTHLLKQNMIEVTLRASSKAVCDQPFSSIIFLESCDLLRVLLLQYRSRLRGRYHIVVKTFQSLVSALFTTSNRPTRKTTPGKNVAVKCASHLARLLTLFCEPPQAHHSSKESGLVDESRKEQAKVGQHVQSVLHHYCTQVLVRAPADGVREALTPGLWSMIVAIEMNDADGIRSLSAAMDNSERAVLRGVYEEWKRFGKWRGG